MARPPHGPSGASPNGRSRRYAATSTAHRPGTIIGTACAPLWAGTEEELPAEAVYLLTGYRADADLMCRAGILLNDRQAPVVNPQSFETNVPGLFVAGGAIAGVDTGTIFIENGRFDGEQIVEAIARRLGDRAS